MLTLRVFDDVYKVCRFSADTPLPPHILQLPFFNISRVDDELSIVVSDSAELPCDTVEDGWGMLGVVGPLDFALTGILSGIANVLAAADVSIFALSTYDTDYILVKKEMLSAAITALENAGYTIA